MIDTLCIKHVLLRPLTDSNLYELGAVQPRGKRHRTFVINPTRNYAPSINFTTTPDNVQHIAARFSAPRLIFGHNAALPDMLETFGSIFAASCFIEQRTGIPFDPLSASVTECHYSRDIEVGENVVIPILQTLSTRVLPGHKRTRLDDTGVYFRRKQSSIVVYSKLHEVQATQPQNHDALASAKGKLRIEYRLSSRAIQNMKIPDRTTRSVIKESISDDFISRAIEKLCLSDALDHTESEPALERLDRIYKPSKAERLFGFLMRVRQYGETFYLNPRFGYDRRQVLRLMRDCRKAGVSPGETS